MTNLDFSDLRATGYKRVELGAPRFAFIHRVWKEAIIFDTRESVIERFDRGIQGRVYLDRTDAWNVEYATANDGGKCGYLPINQVLPLLGYNEK